MLLKHFGERFAAAVACFGVYSDECGIGAGVALLERRGELERMRWNHTVVVVCGGDEGGGI